MKTLDLSTIPKIARSYSGVNITLCDLNQSMKRYNIDTSPYFQRGLVWNQNQKVSFIEAFLREAIIPPIYINRLDAKKTTAGKVIDGQQRLTTLIDFINDEIEVFGGYKYSEIDEIKHSTNIRFEFYRFETEKECVQMYLDLIDGTTGHTEAEMKKARRYLQQLTSDDHLKGCK